MADAEVEMANAPPFSEDVSVTQDAPTTQDVSITLVEGTEIIETQAEPINGAITIEIDGQDDEMTADPESKHVSFVDYLKSSIVNIVVGTGDETTLLRAHRALLIQSPYFADVCGGDADDEGLRSVEFPDGDLDSVGSFLQYLYTGEYFPRKLAQSGALETDPSAPSVDEDGHSLLKHARVYTLAGKLGMPDLQTLAHSKILRINSTAKGEISYARYVYGNTLKADRTIRKPIAAFWGHRSHVLRHEAEEDFRRMCLDYPEFAYDVLSIVLDAKEKDTRKEEKSRDKDHAPMGSVGRKRQRIAHIG